MFFNISFLHNLVVYLIKHKFGWAFSAPVPKSIQKVTHYTEVIRNPSDFGTIYNDITEWRKVEHTADEADTKFNQIFNDCLRVFSNCYLFNYPLSDHSKMAVCLHKEFLYHLNESGLFTHEEIALAQKRHPLFVSTLS